MYNTTALDGSLNPYNILVAVNNLSDGYLAIFVLVTFFLITFLAHLRYNKDSKAVFLSTSTLSMIVAILFWGAELISWTIVIFPIILFIFSIIIYKFTD